MTFKFLSNFCDIHDIPLGILDISHPYLHLFLFKSRFEDFRETRGGGFGFHGMISGIISVWRWIGFVCGYWVGGCGQQSRIHSQYQGEDGW